MHGGRRHSGRISAAIALLFAVSCPAALAQTTFTWDGGGGDNLWNTGANWVGDSAPSRSSSTFLTFAGSTRTSPFNNQGDWQQLAGMTFASGASSFRIEGNTIGFVNASGEQVINQNAAATQEINATFSFGSNQDSRINLNAGDLLISSANVYIDVNGSQYRQLYIAGSDGTRRTVTLTGDVRNSGSGLDADLVIRNNKRVLVTGTLWNGTGTDASVFIDDGVLEFGSSGGMSGGSPALGATSGSGTAAVLLNTAGSTFGRQVEVRGGSTGRRILGGVNTSGTVTFSGNLVATNSPADYDLQAATGGAVNVTGTRNFTSTLNVNRPDGATTYGGTVVLSGTTSSTGGTALHAGTLQFSDWNQLGSDYVEFNASSGDSGTLRYTGGSVTTTRTLWLDNTGITRAAIDVSQAGTTLTWNPGSGTRNQNLTKTGAGWLFFGGGITGGTVGVEAGMLVLTASNSYAGGTVVSGGTLEVSAGGSEGGSPAALGTGTVSIASGAQVKYWLSQSASNTVVNPFSLSGGTLHTTDGYNTYSGRVTLASGSSTISAQYEDTITLSGGLAGSGNVLFTQAGGTGSYAAPTYVLSGTGANSGTVRVNGSSGGSPTKLQLANVNALQSATLDLVTADTGTVQFTVAGNNTYALGGLQGSRNLAFGANALTVGGNGQSTTYSGNLSGSGLVTKAGSGTLTLSGTNFVYGALAIDAGVLALGSAGALQTIPTVSFNGGTLQYATDSYTDYSSRFSNAAGQQYRIDTNGHTVWYMSPLTSSGGSFTKLGAGMLQLLGTNSYDGGTTVSGGTLLGTTASIKGDVVNNAQVYFSMSTTGTYAGTMSGTGSLYVSVTAPLVLSGTNTYSGGTFINSGRLVGTTSGVQGAIENYGVVEFTQAAAGTYAGVMSGTGGVVKSGAGNLTVTATSTYTGATTVSAGRLSVNGRLGTTAVTVQNGAELGGSGRITGSVLVAAGGTLAPGNSIESLGVGATTFSGTSTFAYEYNSSVPLAVGGDLLAVSGDLSIASGALVTFADIAGAPQAFALGTSFAMINYSGTWNGGFFTYGATTLADGTIFTVGSQQWQIDYNRTSSVGLSNYTGDYLPSSSFVAITAVPEPSTVVLGLVGLALGAGLVRRRPVFRRCCCRDVRPCREGP